MKDFIKAIDISEPNRFWIQLNGDERLLATSQNTKIKYIYLIE